MSDRNIRWAEVTKASDDKGPHKIVEVECDGKKMDVMVGETFGVQASPHVGSQVLVAIADGDEGKGVIISSMPRPKDRQDQQKPGEVSVMNHDTGNRIHHDEAGNTNLKTKAALKETVGSDHTQEVAGAQTVNVGGNVIYRSRGILHINPN